MPYIFAADLWCDDCGRAIRESLEKDGRAPEHPEDECSYESDDYPKGPEPEGESDTPKHCGSDEECLNAVELDDGRKVGAIVSGLTEEGKAYVRERLEERDSPCTRFWREHFDLEPEGS